MNPVVVRRRWFITSQAQGRQEVTDGSAYFLASVPGLVEPMYDDGAGNLAGYTEAFQFPLTHSAAEGWHAQYEPLNVMQGKTVTIRAHHSLRPGRVLSEDVEVPTPDPEGGGVEFVGTR